MTTDERKHLQALADSWREAANAATWTEREAANIKCCAGELDYLLSTFTEQQEGVRIEGFIVSVACEDGDDDGTLDLYAEEVNLFSPFHGKDGTLIFIPEDKP